MADVFYACLSPRRKGLQQYRLSTIDKHASIYQLIVDGTFTWLPGHAGLAGTVSADAAAKAALNLPEYLIPVPYTDFYPS